MTDITGNDFKQYGLQLVETHNPDFVALMRLVAVSIATIEGTVTCDDLRDVASAAGLYPKHPNAWGAIFKGKEWRRVGYENSRIPSNHARIISVWKHI